MVPYTEGNRVEAGHSPCSLAVRSQGCQASLALKERTKCRNYWTLLTSTWVCRALLPCVTWTAVQGPGTFIKKNGEDGFKSRENVISYSYDRRRGVDSHRPVSSGIQIFGLIPLPLGISLYVLLNWREVKSLIKVLVRSVRTNIRAMVTAFAD